MKKLKQELKKMIVSECQKDMDFEHIKDDEILFGEDSNLALDSLDALQISMALQNKYNIKLTDGKKLRKVMTNINTLAQYIHDQQNQ